LVIRIKLIHKVLALTVLNLISIMYFTVCLTIGFATGEPRLMDGMGLLINLTAMTSLVTTGWKS